MELNSQFVRLLASSIKEKEKKEFNTGKQISKIKSSNRSYYDQNAFRDKTLYDILQTKAGIDEFQSIIIHKFKFSYQASQQKEIGEPLRTQQQQPQQQSDNVDEFMDSYEFDESRLFIFLREIYNEVPEYKIGEIFDLVGNLKEYISFKEVFLIILYTVACESRQQLQFFHSFGQCVFQILSGERLKIYGAKMRMFGKLIGVPEKRLEQSLRELGISEEEEYEYQEFELLFFSIFVEQSASNPDNSKLFSSIPNSPQKQSSFPNKKDLQSMREQQKYQCSVF